MGLELWGDCVSECLVTDTLTIIVASGTLLFSHHLRIWLSLYSFWPPSPSMNSSVCTLRRHWGSPPVLWFQVVSLLDALRASSLVAAPMQSGGRHLRLEEAARTASALSSPRTCHHIPWWSHLLSAPHVSLSSRRGVALLAATLRLTPRGKAPLSWLSDPSGPSPCSRAALLTHCGRARRQLSSL